ncbi:rCG47012 [Rattus norvegicus]|uniref:RCG47012 n=1 Tax=Rattus norvegicus TaxID=10116 RepID=A6K4X5_RAT|nr:rCG47012 [Rattus norvegicus]
MLLNAKLIFSSSCGHLLPASALAPTSQSSCFLCCWFYSSLSKGTSAVRAVTLAISLSWSSCL